MTQIGLFIKASPLLRLSRTRSPTLQKRRTGCSRILFRINGSENVTSQIETVDDLIQRDIAAKRIDDRKCYVF